MDKPTLRPTTDSAGPYYPAPALTPEQIAEATQIAETASRIVARHNCRRASGITRFRRFGGKGL